MIQEKMFEIISDICYFNIEEMNLDLSVEDDLAINSVMIVEIVAMIENELGISIEESVNELIGCTTLGDMVNLIEGLLKE
ncbi:acyl carrier protein [Clostridium estertheticum]|uniref:acyl carrier protein n=1 Tax=Clostridium estertheticum TaxID=238834 RepID=UPI0013EE7B0D|nr:acyl carrier protein [Clostridium estertheticum]MBZ9609064.1 acyl carrier protein [Clostridium estertheticum]